METQPTNWKHVKRTGLPLDIFTALEATIQVIQILQKQFQFR